MKSQPRPLFVLHRDRTLHERLVRASQSRFVFSPLQDWKDLLEGMTAAPPAAVVVVDPYFDVEKGQGPSNHLYDLLKAFPSSTVIAAMDTSPPTYRDVWLMGEWGIAEIIQIDEDKSQVALSRRLMRARSQPLRKLLSQDPGVPLSGRARSLMDAAVETVMMGGHPRDLARSLGFSPSTLLRWCERSQLPNPRRLLLWFRVLFASALLDDPGHTIFSVGLACGYSGDQALRRAMKSVIPQTPTRLRQQGAFDIASAAFFKELASLRNDEAEAR